MENEGHDFEFVPIPDNKYECPICLLILRDPVQTECGHRFCKFCIERWLREGNCKCPIDNVDLDQHKMFPDNFVKREILSMKVRCPYTTQGCESVIELKHIEEHKENCMFQFVPCPNNCNLSTLRKDMEEHLADHCSKRKIQCTFCKEKMVFEIYGEHEGNCPSRLVPCDFCKADVMREKIPEHMAIECPNATIKCCFYIFGCDKEIERQKMEKHMKSSVQKHLQLMCHAFVKLLTFQNIESILSSIGTGNTGSQNHSDTVNEPAEMSGELSILLQAAEGGASGGADAGIFKFVQIPPPRTISQPTLAPQQSTPIHRSQSDKTNSSDKVVFNLGDAASSSELFDTEFQSLKERNLYQDESLARHNHEILELRYKLENVERLNKELRLKFRTAEEKLNAYAEFEGRLCNGLFIWKIKSYSRHRHEAEIGEIPVLHSPPFYSNFYGYKLCMRCNLNGVDFSVGSHLSVFIHFMQGEWDDVLTWPFRGKIVLSVLDQNPNADQRQHAVETLIAKPMLAAFQKPTTHRNHKGFGYMEYVPLEVLDNSTYVINDTLILKAQIFPEL